DAPSSSTHTAAATRQSSRAWAKAVAEIPCKGGNASIAAFLQAPHHFFRRGREGVASAKPSRTGKGCDAALQITFRLCGRKRTRARYGILSTRKRRNRWGAAGIVVMAR